MNDDDYNDARLIVHAVIGCVVLYAAILLGVMLWPS
jgi:hypothetical protein